MKYNILLQKYLGCNNSKETFQKLQDTFTDSITVWDYFVNWILVPFIYVFLNILKFSFN
jgi:type II restriction enzyme